MGKIKKKILLIVTGGIACYKSLDLIRRLQEKKILVECILTNNAKEFINPISFESLLGNEIHSNLFSLNQEKKMSHINLANECDAIIIVPCTANFLGKMANGVADDLATNVLLASNKKKIIAPSMNTNMWKNLAVKKNLESLKKMGVDILTPQTGKLACGSYGAGKLMNVDLILEYLEDFLLKKKDLQNIKAVITAGPSIEEIDPVRYISNFSSGKQGYEIAKSLSSLGAKTTLISGPTNLSTPRNVKFLEAKSGKDFLDSALSELPCDLFISVAAISDWKVEKIKKNKIKKNNLNSLNLTFKKNHDVLKLISNHKKRPKLIIGFSAETSNILNNSKIKLKEKNCDWILANKVSKNVGFQSDKNKVFFINNTETKEWALMKKLQQAEDITKQESFENYPSLPLKIS